MVAEKNATQNTDSGRVVERTEEIEVKQGYNYGSIKSINPFPNDKFLTLPNLQKEFADVYSKCDENGRKFSKKGRKHSGKRRNRSLCAISPFSTVFSKDL